MATLTLTFLVHKEKNRVVFAEADKDFVDILFSFLTLPLGTVIRLLGKQSTVGCVDNLYESVEKMDAEYLETTACKTMLLQPRSEAEAICEDLKINVDDLNPRRLYRCPTYECFAMTQRLYSSVSDVPCPCGKTMNQVPWTKIDNEDIGNGDGIFVKGGNRFIISDDLHIMPAFPMKATLSLLRKNGIRDTEELEKKTVDITRDKLLKLLNRVMLSTTPLTDIFLPNLDTTMGCGNEGQECEQLKDIKQIKTEDGSTAKSTSSIRVNILYDKLNKKVVCIQAGDDFVDVLFSFLTFPLGCIVKLLEGYSSLGCLDNLYKSVEFLNGTLGINSVKCKNLLLAPKLAAHFGCCNQLLRTEEQPSVGVRAQGCEICWEKGISVPERACKHNIDVAVLIQINPKLSISCTERGGGYAKKSIKFMITNDMVVTPLSPISGIDAIRQSKSPIHCLVEKDVELGEAEVADLLKACLISPTALANVFCSKKMKKILQLLKRLLLSTTPLTDIFLRKLDTTESCTENQECQLKGITQTKSQDSTAKSTSSIRMNILYNKVNNKVVSAETGEDLVDVLFSFLTFSLGCIVKLLEGYSSTGCLDNLYKSVEILDGSFGIKSEECKNILLAPKLYTHFGCSSQLLRTKEKPSQRYRNHGCEKCWNEGIAAPLDKLCKHGISVVFLTQVNPKLSSSGTECGGGYAKKSARFVITDDIAVMPLSLLSGIDAIDQSNALIPNLAEKEIMLGEVEILQLLKRLLLSTTPLTDVFLRKLDTTESCTENQEIQLKGIAEIKSQDSTAKSSSSIRMNILYDKVNNKVVSAEAGEDLVDVLFSFLTFPLGCIVRLLEGYSSTGCLDNLYKSVEILDGSFGIKSEECKKLLLAPKLYTHFGCSSQLLRTEEKPSQRYRSHGCEKCWNDGIAAPLDKLCKHGISVVFLTQLNPKLSSSGTECGGGYAKKSARFVITDDMAVMPLSIFAGIDAINQSKALIPNLAEKEIMLGEVEAANLLKACLNSRTPLTNLLCSKKTKKVFY